MSDSVSLENCDAWLVAVVVVFVIVISSRIASGRRAAGARRDEEGACALFCGRRHSHTREDCFAPSLHAYHGYRLSRGWGWVASGSLSRTSSGRMLASGSCYFRARTLTHRSTRDDASRPKAALGRDSYPLSTTR